MTPTTPTGRGTSPMLPPAGMGLNMPSLCPVEGRVVPPSDAPSAYDHHAEERQAGNSFLVEGGRANGLVLVTIGQDRANDRGHDIAYGLPRPVGVEVVTLTDETLDLHAPSIRMETGNVVRESSAKVSGRVHERFFGD
jgi:hypothetical protein